MVQAGAMGSPFVAVRGFMGSDILKYRNDFIVLENPFNSNESLVVVHQLCPDVAIFHALKADIYGNAITPGLRDDLRMARASHLVIVTTEEVTEKPLTLEGAVNNTFLPAIDVDIVISIPFGSHPCGCGDLYEHDDRHIKEYLEATKEEGSLKTYLDQYVYSVDSHWKYLERVGISAPTEGGTGS